MDVRLTYLPNMDEIDYSLKREISLTYLPNMDMRLIYLPNMDVRLTWIMTQLCEAEAREPNREKTMVFSPGSVSTP